MRVSFCIKCSSWQEGQGPCEFCGLPLDTQQVLEGELNETFARLVMALQGVAPYREHRDAVQLDPRLWGIEPAGIVRAAVNPLFWVNRTNPQTRLAINLLTSVAGQYGIEIERAQEYGEELKMTDADGTTWLMWKRKSDGLLSTIRRLEQAPEYACEECGQTFPNPNSLYGHGRIHKKGAGRPRKVATA